MVLSNDLRMAEGDDWYVVKVHYMNFGCESGEEQQAGCLAV
jgi:hypothetical protein